MTAAVDHAWRPRLSSRSSANCWAPRSTYYHAGVGESDENLQLMRLIDEQYLHTPFYGSRGMTQWLMRQGHDVNRKRVRRLMRVMGLEAIYPRPRTSVPCPEHRIYPYLLRNLAIERPNQVWSADITYVPLRRGLHVPGGGAGLAQPLRAVVGAVEHAGQRRSACRPWKRRWPAAAGDLQHRSRGAVHQPGVHRRAGDCGDRDQHGWPRAGPRQRVHRAAVADGEVRRRSLQRLLRDGAELRSGLIRYFRFYNTARPHQALGKQTPAEVHFG